MQKILFILLTSLLASLLASLLPLQTGANEIHSYTTSETKLLSAFIWNISKFTQWKSLVSKKPKEHRIKLIVVDNDSLAEDLKTLIGAKKLNDFEVEVQSAAMAKLEQTRGEIVVLIPDVAHTPSAALKKLKGCRCLSVTYEEGLALEGAIVNFYTVDERLRFEINLHQAKEEGLELSSQLLKLGKLIE